MGEKEDKEAQIDYQAAQYFDRTVALHYFNAKCGVLHLSRALDEFWGLVALKVIIPACLKIHAELVKRKHTQTKPHSFNDADDAIWHIPVKNKMVFVHTTQNWAFLYVLYYPSDRSPKEEPSIHVRRLWRSPKEELFGEPAQYIKDLGAAIKGAEQLMNCALDDEYASRPSLDFYKKIKFCIPYHPEDKAKDFKHNVYGDMRDRGYILSYNGRFGYYMDNPPRVEGSKSVINFLEVISTCYIPSIACEFGLEVQNLDGY